MQEGGKLKAEDRVYNSSVWCMLGEKPVQGHSLTQYTFPSYVNIGG